MDSHFVRRTMAWLLLASFLLPATDLMAANYVPQAGRFVQSLKGIIDAARRQGIGRGLPDSEIVVRIHEKDNVLTRILDSVEPEQATRWRADVEATRRLMGQQFPGNPDGARAALRGMTSDLLQTAGPAGRTMRHTRLSSLLEPYRQTAGPAAPAKSQRALESWHERQIETASRERQIEIARAWLHDLLMALPDEAFRSRRELEQAIRRELTRRYESPSPEPAAETAPVEVKLLNCTLTGPRLGQIGIIRFETGTINVCRALWKAAKVAPVGCLVVAACRDELIAQGRRFLGEEVQQALVPEPPSAGSGAPASDR